MSSAFFEVLCAVRDAAAPALLIQELERARWREMLAGLRRVVREREGLLLL